jgi:hypothetical protein
MSCTCSILPCMYDRVELGQLQHWSVRGHVLVLRLTRELLEEEEEEEGEEEVLLLDLPCCCCAATATKNYDYGRTKAAAFILCSSRRSVGVWVVSHFEFDEMSEYGLTTSQ